MLILLWKQKLPYSQKLMAFSRILKSALLLFCSFFTYILKHRCNLALKFQLQLEFLQPFTTPKHVFSFLICEHCPLKTQAKEVSTHDVPVMDHSCLLSQFYPAIYCCAASSNDQVVVCLLY